MALKGTLKDFGIADILQLIGQQQKTGTLHLKGRDEEVQIGFSDGSIVKAQSATRKKKDLIGSMLVRAGLITQEDLEQALDAQKRSLKRLGDVLVSSRMITRERFAEMVQLQTTETLYKLFSWKTGTYEFEQGEVEFDPASAVRFRAESILMEGFRMVDEWPVIKKTITSYELGFERLKELPPAPEVEEDLDSDLDDAFGEAPKQENKGEFKSVGAGERRIYGLVAQGRDVRAFIDLGCIGEFETCKALLNLVNLGYLRVIAPEGRTHAVGGSDPGAERIAGGMWRVAVTALVLAVLGLVVSRLGLHSFDLSNSPTSFADPAAQAVISRAQLARIESALSVYRLEKGELPEKLDALVASGLLEGQDLRYPWREMYYYRRNDAGGFVLLPPLR